MYKHNIRKSEAINLLEKFVLKDCGYIQKYCLKLKSIQDEFFIFFVSVHYRTQAMLIENCGTLRYVPDCYKNKKICKKTIDNYPYALEFVLESYKTKKMCDKAVDTYPSTI